MIVITACYSKNPCRPYDHPKAPPAGVAHAYAFTDDPLWFEAGWERPPLERNNRQMHPRLRGKAPKAAPHMFVDGTDDVLWVDSSMRWTGKPLCELFDLVPPQGVGAFDHRFRKCIYAEAEASVEPGFNRYAREPIAEQVKQYAADGYPRDAGLFELGCIVWRGAQWRIGAKWLAEMLAWTSQDQISFPYVCWGNDVRPTKLPGNAVQNEWFRYVDHMGEE